VNASRLEGSAGPVEPLGEDEVYHGGAEVMGEKTALVVGGSTIAGTLTTATEELSWFTKLMLFGALVGLCVLFVKMNTPRRTAMAGRHGAYEKSAA